MAKVKICLPCEREKAKLPTYGILAKQRAINENKTIVVYFDDEDKKYYTTDLETAQKRGYKAVEYYTPL